MSEKHEQAKSFDTSQQKNTPAQNVPAQQAAAQNVPVQGFWFFEPKLTQIYQRRDHFFNPLLKLDKRSNFFFKLSHSNHKWWWCKLYSYVIGVNQTYVGARVIIVAMHFFVVAVLWRSGFIEVKGKEFVLIALTYT